MVYNCQKSTFSLYWEIFIKLWICYLLLNLSYSCNGMFHQILLLLSELLEGILWVPPHYPLHRHYTKDSNRTWANPSSLTISDWLHLPRPYLNDFYNFIYLFLLTMYIIFNPEHIFLPHLSLCTLLIRNSDFHHCVLYSSSVQWIFISIVLQK